MIIRSAVVLLALTASARAATYTGGNYNGNDLVLANGDVITGTFTGVGRFEVPQNATVIVTGRAIVGATTVRIDGNLDGTGRGNAGGIPSGVASQGVGSGPGGGSAGVLICPISTGGGGGGHGGSGGGPTVPGGPPYGSATSSDHLAGSGGGAGATNQGCGSGAAFGGPGGAGGAAVKLTATGELRLAGSIRMSGAPGIEGEPGAGFTSGGGGGGGSGGGIVLVGGLVSVTGTLRADGATGADGDLEGVGGGGAGGRVTVRYGVLGAGVPQLQSTVNPGANGDGDMDAAPGTVHVAAQNGLCADADADGFLSCIDDCDDQRPGVNPDAPEVCNGLDDDCDGQSDEGLVVPTWWIDADADGVAGTAVQQCTAPPGASTSGPDCDDADDEVYPGAAEVCDGQDQDCDDDVDEGAIDAGTWYGDGDGDGRGDPDAAVQTCVQPGGTVSNDDDCDDDQPLAWTGRPESCDGVDNDCDGVTDPPTSTGASTWYDDDDGDGRGDPGASVQACTVPTGHVANADDCDDDEPLAWTGRPESCDGVDNDCNGVTDPPTSTGATAWYDDDDGDGRGDPDDSVQACAAPTGRVGNANDCNDAEPAAWTGRPELCDGVDNDCDGVTDPPTSTGALPWYPDVDQDGFGDPEDEVMACTAPGGHIADDQDCDDTDPDTHPGADETCDGADDDCDGTADEAAIDRVVFFVDEDEDGFGTAETDLACSLVPGLATVGGDCNDSEASTNPGAYDQCGDLVDNDCDLLVDENTALIAWYQDDDGDGYGAGAVAVQDCVRPDGHAQFAGDCDETDPEVHPNAFEVCDGVDQDCDGTVDDAAVDGFSVWPDEDGDGFGRPGLSVRVCDTTGTAPSGTDCDDLDAAVNPGAPEVCNGIDDNCNVLVDDNPSEGTLVWADADGDGFGQTGAPTLTCGVGPGTADVSGDCDDANSAVNPGAQEVCAVGDEDCDGEEGLEDPSLDLSTLVSFWVDADGDGYGVPGSPGSACEIPEGNAGAAGDCDDGDADIHPAASDVPGDGLDQDCDGQDADPTVDSDGDGIPDHVELLWGGDPDGADSDGDGIPDADEGLTDSDGDGLPDFVDEDDDGDGLPSALEGDADVDGDGVPNHLDDDSDGDGSLDAAEGDADADQDGVPAFLDAGGGTPGTAGAPTYGFGCRSVGSRGGALGLLALFGAVGVRRREFAGTARRTTEFIG